MGDAALKRILAVDPGEARIGIAISDPLATIARPLTVIDHTSREQDAASILELACKHQVLVILVGIPLDDEGKIGPQARKSVRLAEALRAETNLNVVTWDESGSTKQAQLMGGTKNMIDARAAAVILQDYLDVQAA